jgi:methylglutaconyl-CoA hydratase
MPDNLLLIQENGVATLSLNRPEVHNAFDAALIAELTATLQRLDGDTDVRVVVLTGSGASFSAGADLSWMREMAKAGEADNRADSLKLAQLMRTLEFLSKPTVARVNGAAYGGGVGLIACCDVAIATDAAKFGLTEVKLGLVPAVISPYVIRAVGPRHARRLFLNGAVFGAQKALAIGLVHAIAPANELDSAVDTEVGLLLKAGPIALREAKQLIHRNFELSVAAQERIDESNAELIARLRVSREGQEGLSAFLDKRTPAWVGSAKER